MMYIDEGISVHIMCKAFKICLYADTYAELTEFATAHNFKIRIHDRVPYVRINRRRAMNLLEEGQVSKAYSVKLRELKSAYIRNTMKR